MSPISDEALMQCARRLWGATVERGVLDYRQALFKGDEDEARTIEKQMDVMGYGEYMPKLRENTERFKRAVDAEIRRDPKKRRRVIDCPACGSKRRCEIIRRKTALSAICYACGVRYHFPVWRLKEEEETDA